MGIDEWKVLVFDLRMPTAVSPSILTFSISDSGMSGYPLGSASQIHPKTLRDPLIVFNNIEHQHRHNRLSNYCPSYFRTLFPSGKLARPCAEDPEGNICKFTGFGGYVCCSKIGSGACSIKNNCDIRAGRVFSPSSNTCVCKDGF